MNRKTLLILNYLMDGKPHRVTDLAGYLNLSPRLVRYEMEEVNAFLEKEGFPFLRNESTEGLSMKLSRKQKESLEKKLVNLSTYDYVMTSFERRRIMLLLMLANGDRPLTGQYFADQMSVSKSSIDKDMILLKSDLKGSGVRLESRTRKGSSLKGDERDIRKLSVRILEQHLNFASFYHQQNILESIDMIERFAYRLFCDNIIPPLFKIVQNREWSDTERPLAYDSFRMITLAMAVAVVRMRTGKTINVMPASMLLVKTTSEYMQAIQMSKEIEAQFHMKLPEEEICTLAFLLISAEYVTPELYLKDDWVEVQLLSDCLVRDMSEEMGIDFSKDKEIYRSLQPSLGSIVFRLRHGIPTINPGLLEIKRGYRECFDSLVLVIERLNSELLSNITEDEITWLVLHFCASAERQKRVMLSGRVAIVCAYGIGTANLLREAVCSRYRNIQVVATIPFADMQYLQKLDVDFVISSIPLPGYKQPWVKVSAIPTDRDWENIDKMILQNPVRVTHAMNTTNVFNKVIDIVQKYCQIQDTDEFIAEIATCFEANDLAVHMERHQPTLESLLRPERLRCHCKAVDWEDAVKQACGVLTETGDTTNEFTDSAIQSVKKAGAYIVIMPGVALVHGDVGKGVERLAMSMITLESPIRFYHPSNDPVWVIFCLAPIDNWSHIHAFRGLLKLLNRVAVQTLCSVDTPQELYEYLKEGCE